MPWKECRPVDERIRFAARLLDGEKMAVMCLAQFRLYACPAPSPGAISASTPTPSRVQT